MSKKPPEVFVIAGPNSAGKTTFAREFLPKQVDCLEFLNADLIAQGLSPFSPQSEKTRAGKLFLTRLRELSNNAGISDLKPLFRGETMLFCSGPCAKRVTG
jgi:predicted ABC-type ATPase